ITIEVSHATRLVVSPYQSHPHGPQGPSGWQDDRISPVEREVPTDRVDGSIGLPSSYGSIEMAIPAKQRANPPTTPKKRQLGLVGPAGSSENTKMYAELRAIPAPPIERRITGS